MQRVSVKWNQNFCEAMVIRKQTLTALHKKLVGQGMNAKTMFEKATAFQEASGVEYKLNQLHMLTCIHFIDCEQDIEFDDSGFYGDAIANRIYEV